MYYLFLEYNMIEIEIFQRNNANDKHSIKVWKDKKMHIIEDIFSTQELNELYNELCNELRWLGDYLKDVACIEEN